MSEWQTAEDTVPSRFEQVVRRYPHNLALKTIGGAITYAALNQRANRIAQAILERRGESAEPVAILLDSSISAVAAILGVLKAGKFYVVLDTDFPESRLQDMQEDIRPGLLLSDASHVSLAHKLAASSCSIVNLDEVCETSLAVSNPELALAPDRLAEIVYTTGSTGRPKGVLHSHCSLLHNCIRLTRALQLSSSEKITSFASLNTGQGRTTHFRALLLGATVCVWPIKQRGVSGLADWLQAEAITFFYSSAAVFRAFARTLTGGESFPSLRLLRVGGATIYSRDLELFQSRFAPTCHLLNSLDSTEVSSMSVYRVDRENPVRSHIVPVGYPLEGVEVLVLDELGAPVAANQPGEIVLKSRYLSPGYWRQPELTASRFRPDPDGGPERLYFSGDVGSRGPDGCLTHLGRRDTQVKVRGYRVVLSEVEDSIRTVAAVHDVAVVFDEERDRLLAYLIAANEPPTPTSAIRSALAARFPDYVVPSRFFYVDSFPLLPSGKVDRQALPAPDRLRPELETPLRLASTPLEEELAALWSSLLGIAPVGIHDDFLLLGGHSLLIARLLVEVERRYGQVIPLPSFFLSPTIAGLAATLCAGRPSQGEANLSRAEAGPFKSVLDVLELPKNFVPAGRPRIEFEQEDLFSRLLYRFLHAMPRAFSIRLFSFLTASARLRAWLFRLQEQRNLRFLKSLDGAPEGEAALASTMYFSLIERYRLGQGRPQVEGLEKLAHARERGQGVVMVRSHDTAGPWFRLLNLSDDRVGRVAWTVEQLSVRSRFDEPALYVHQLSGAVDSLRAGRVVEIHGDGSHGGSPGVKHQFHGKRRRFFTGFAELAVMTGAAVFVAYSSWRLPADACVRLVGPLDCGGPHLSFDERVERLVGTYVGLLRSQWAQEPWMVPCWVMDEHLRSPLA